MARKVQTQLIDDLDGSPAAETITFALDAKSYEIDLNETHALELRAALAPYIAVAARLGSRSVINPIEPRADKLRKSGKPSKRAAQSVRDWARSQGIEVGDKGRLSADLLARYEAAQRSDSAPTQSPAPVAAESEITLGTDEVRTVAIPESDDWDDETVELANSPEVRTLIPAFQSV